MSFLNKKELSEVGFKSVGTDVFISRKASIYGAENIIIGNHVRIDDFCILSASESMFIIGDYIHIAAFSSLIGKGEIVLSSYSNISSRVSIYSSSDDFSGEFMTNPMLPTELTNVKSQPVFIGMHAIIGCGSVILPGSFIEEGVAIGALSLVNKRCQAFNIYAGTPLIKIKERKADMLNLEREFFNKNRG